MVKFFSKNKKVILGILFTALCLLVWRIGVRIPTPFLEIPTSAGEGESIFGFLDVFTGGALSQFSVVALGVSPYITSSIIVQLLQMDIVPAFKEWADEGAVGKQKLNAATKYIALALAFVQAMTLVVGISVSYNNVFFGTGTPEGLMTYIYLSIVMVAGTAFVLWLADKVTKHGVGNGTSLFIVAGIIAGYPSMFVSLYNQYLGETVQYAPTAGNIIKFIFNFLNLFIIFYIIL